MHIDPFDRAGAARLAAWIGIVIEGRQTGADQPVVRFLKGPGAQKRIFAKMIHSIEDPYANNVNKSNERRRNNFRENDRERKMVRKISKEIFLSRDSQYYSPSFINRTFLDLANETRIQRTPLSPSCIPGEKTNEFGDEKITQRAQRSIKLMKRHNSHPRIDTVQSNKIPLDVLTKLNYRRLRTI